MRHKNFTTVAGAILFLTLTVVPAHAQRHRGRGPIIVRSPLLFSSYYDPFFAFGQPGAPNVATALGWEWYPYPYPVFGIPPGPGFFGRDPFSSVRLQVTPREGLVYVDGYAAGMVDDFDGVFQRLQLIPGHHEIVVYLQGYRTFRQNLYLNPGSSHTIRHTLVPLAQGEAAEPQPVPLMPPAQARGIPPWQSAPSPTSRFGNLTLRVQPVDASIVVDGEAWKGPQSQDRLVIQLAEGIHQLRVEKPGFQTFAVEIDIKAGETTSFNVSLLTQ